MGNPLAGAGNAPLGANVNRETLTGNKTLAADDVFVQSYDPDGARTVTLPAEQADMSFLIVNRASGAEDITVEDDASTTIGVVSQNEAGLFICDGTGWILLLGAAASVQS